MLVCTFFLFLQHKIISTTTSTVYVPVSNSSKSCINSENEGIGFGFLNCSCFLGLSSSIAVRSRTQEEEEDDVVELRNHFPNFLWLLRDVHLLPVDDSGLEIPPTKYLKTKVLVRGKRFTPTKSDDVSRAILSFFPTVECMTLPPPHADPSRMRDIASNEHLLEKRFNDKVHTLIQYLLQKVQPKKGYIKGMCVDGILFAEMVIKYLESLNDPDSIPCLDNTWQSVVGQRCSAVTEELVAEYDAVPRQHHCRREIREHFICCHGNKLYLLYNSLCVKHLK